MPSTGFQPPSTPHHTTPPLPHPSCPPVSPWSSLAPSPPYTRTHTHPTGGPRELIEAVEDAGYGAALWKEGQDDATGALHT